MKSAVFVAAILGGMALCALSPSALASEATAGETSFTADRLVALLEAGEISEGESDAIFRGENSGLQHTRNGRYSVFYMPGMNVSTDSISLISRDGALIYANYGSCSDSKTYFRSNTAYFQYLLSAR